MSAEIAIEQEEQAVSLLEYVNILRRRKKSVAISFAAVLIITFVIAFVWPPTYQSEAIILIEEQQIPSSLVQTTITSYAQQRIEELKVRIMTIGNIMKIVDQFDLYTEKQLQRKTRSEIANEFRKAVSIEPISADVVDPQSGRPREAVIAFNMAFEGAEPAKVQKVANELTDLYLNENLKERTAQTKSTSAFLASEAELLSQRLDELDEQIAEFKLQNENALPQFHGRNVSIVQRTEEDLSNLEFQIKELTKRQTKLENDLIGVSPSAPVVLATGERVLGDADRLKALESELRQKSAVYREDHPDLSRIKREIDELLNSAGGVDGSRHLAEQLQVEQDRLQGLKSKYTADHPQVIASERVVDQLQQELTQYVEAEEKIKPDNPAYLIISNELDSITKDLRAADKRELELTAKLEAFEEYVSQGPQVEKEFLVLARERQTTQSKYTEIRAKQMHAEMAQSPESEQKGERFTLIQPAELPSEPVSPNRPAIVFLGVILGAVIGVGVGVLRELMAGGVYGPRAVMDITGASPLAIVGYIETDREARDHNKLRLYMVLGLVLSLILFMTAFHAFIKPLDVTWFVLSRKFGF